MALATLTDLEAQLASWLDRDDLTNEFPDFIKLAEQDVLTGSGTRKPLRIRQMEGRATAAVSTVAFSLPADFLEMRGNPRITAPTPGRPLKLADPDYLAQHYPVDATGTPVFYAIVGPEIILGPAPNASHTIELDYYAFTALSATAPTNWLLTGAPGVYLFGALKYAALRTRGEERAATWSGLFEAALQGLVRADRFGRFPAGALVSRPSGATP